MFRLPPLPTMLRAVVGSGASVARRVVGREFSGGLWSGEKRGLRRLLALPLTWPSPYDLGHFHATFRKKNAPFFTAFSCCMRHGLRLAGSQSLCYKVPYSGVKLYFNLKQIAKIYLF
jgi:hypothetical protein